MSKCVGTTRTMRCELSFLNRADGSACFSQGRTTVWASCSGPGDVHISRRENERLTVDVSYRPSSGNAEHHKLNNIITMALEGVVNMKKFPRSCIVVSVHGLQTDGSEGATALTAACLAALDNGIPMKFPFCGVQIVLVDGTLIVDPDAKTEQKATANFLLAFHMTQDGAALLCSDCFGTFSLEEFSSAISLGTEAAKQVFVFFRETLQRKLAVDCFTRSDG